MANFRGFYNIESVFFKSGIFIIMKKKMYLEHSDLLFITISICLNSHSANLASFWVTFWHTLNNLKTTYFLLMLRGGTRRNSTKNV